MIHCFNLFNQIENRPERKYCLEQTQKFQSSQIKIWTENDEELSEFIKKSRYCSVAKERNLASLYDYVKLYIMSKYDGWYIENDHIVKTDLNKLSFDKSHIQKISGSQFITTWSPIFIKSTDIDKSILKKFESDFLTPFIENEAITCKVEGSFEGVSSLNIQFAHYDTRTFFRPDDFGWKRVYFLDSDENVKVFYKDYFGTNTNAVIKYSDINEFVKIASFSNFFQNGMNELILNGNILISDKFNDSLRNCGINLNCKTLENAQIQMHESQFSLQSLI